MRTRVRISPLPQTDALRRSTKRSVQQLMLIANLITRHKHRVSRACFRVENRESRHQLIQIKFINLTIDLERRSDWLVRVGRFKHYEHYCEMYLASFCFIQLFCQPFLLISSQATDKHITENRCKPVITSIIITHHQEILCHCTLSTRFLICSWSDIEHC